MESIGVHNFVKNQLECLGGYLGRSKICSDGLCHLGGLLECSWSPLGPPKSTLDRLLEALGRIPRQFSAIIRAKTVPNGPPEGVKTGSKIEASRKCRNH